MTSDAWFSAILILMIVFAALASTRYFKRRPPRPVDPVAEAQLYLAYGRSEQAKVLLRKALAQDPASSRLASELRRVEARYPD